MSKGKFVDDSMAEKKAQFYLLKKEGLSINHISELLNLNKKICRNWENEKLVSDIVKKKINYDELLAQRCFDGFVSNIILSIALTNIWLNSFDKKDMKRIESNIDKITRVVGVSADKVLRLIELRKLDNIEDNTERIQIDLRRSNKSDSDSDSRSIIDVEK